MTVLDAGGSHLPDITVMTPAFHNGEIVFWVRRNSRELLRKEFKLSVQTASRAHHADIGGVRAGSMPPFSKTIEQEGAQILSYKLVKQGHFDEEGITDLMYHQPAKYPGCSGTRTLSDVCLSFSHQPFGTLTFSATTEHFRSESPSICQPSRSNTH